MQGKSFHNVLLSTVCSVLLMLLGIGAAAQDGILDIHGSVKNEASRKNMEGVQVKVAQDGKEYDTFTTAGNGRYGFNLPLGHKYMFTFSADGMVYKKIEINTKGIPPEDMAGGFKLNMDMTLFDMIEGFDMKIMEAPLGKASFDPIRNSVEFDYDYTAQMQQKIADELKRLEKLAKDMEKFLKQFNELVAQGDQAMSAKKYADAVAKYEAALKVIPDREPAVAKLAEAQAKLDEENAARELEQRYTSLITQAKSDIGKKKFQEAKDALVEAQKLKPAEREPKDLLDSIEKELAALAKRAEYDGLIAAADKDFNGKNYAISIEKYEQASAMFPAETYPRDQIKAARKILDDQLAAAAEEEERNRRYNEAMAAGDRNVKDKNYQAAINNYKDAQAAKPAEKLPPQKIKEVEGLIAAAAKAESDAAAAADQAERDRLEREYRDLIKKADDKFAAKKLEEAKADYQTAVALRPDDNYPKSRIERIDQLLAETEAQARESAAANEAAAKAEAEYRAMIADADAKFDAGDLEEAKAVYEGAQLVRPSDKYPATRITRINEMLAKASNAEADRLAEEARKREEERLAAEEAERLAREARLNEQEAERLRRQQEEEAERARLAAERERQAEEERRRTSEFANNADATSEDEAERYYREARQRDDLAKRDRINEKKEDNSRLLNRREQDADASMRRYQEEKLEIEENMTRIYRDGQMNHESRVDAREAIKEEHADNLSEYNRKADNRRSTAADNARTQHATQQALAANDSYREAHISEVERKEEESLANLAAYASKGDARRVNNEFEVEEKNTKLANIAGDGENVRLDNVAQVEDKKDQYSNFENDLRRAADERKVTGAEAVEEKKAQFRDVGEGKEVLAEDNMTEIRRTKERASDQQTDLALAARDRAYDRRKELFSLSAGEKKSVDDYRLPPGYENLEEGVQEKSYEEGNKMVIERTVRRGNKVDTYRKVISKTGIYYFKNGVSITEGLWKRETLDAQN